MTSETASPSFHGLGIDQRILATLDKLRFVTPTPIQNQAIPHGLAGRDVLGIAQTGTGKTLAFGIPTVQFLGKSYGRALILVPTRELAVQVDETMRKIAEPLGMSTAVIIGGANMKMQTLALQKGARIIIATPGRLFDHAEQGTTDLRDICVLVLDEADRMLDMGFLPQIERILQYLPEERQTMLFSATMPNEIMNIVNKQMVDPIRVEVARAGTAAEKVIQELFVVRRDHKNRLLQKLLDRYQGTVLLFSRTKIGAHRVSRAIREMRHSVAEIHSDRSLPQRRAALEGFKAGTYRILVATDIAARGIDVKEIELVINYDLPDEADNYIHRIGRTGRAGHEGRAISFATPDQEKTVREIEKLMKMPLPLAQYPDLPQEPFDAPGASHGASRGGRPHGGGRPASQPHRPQGQQGHRPQGQHGPRSHGHRSQGQPGHRSHGHQEPRAQHGQGPRQSSHGSPATPAGEHGRSQHAAHRPQGQQRQQTQRPSSGQGGRHHRPNGGRRHGRSEFREHGGGELRHTHGA